jgi:hypothetical protein
MEQSKFYLGHGIHRHVIELVRRAEDSGDGLARHGQSKVGVINLSTKDTLCYIMGQYDTTVKNSQR